MDVSRLAEVLVVVVFTSVGQLLLRLGARGLDLSAGGIGDLVGTFLRAPLLWLAVGLYAISTLLWIRVLSRYPVGSVYPMVAVSYVLVTIGGAVLLGERVPLQAWLALAIICAGVLLLAATPVQGR
jgi:undecaprenyl phosphate-alpha-L-ara4N flippase subunit ArnE